MTSKIRSESKKKVKSPILDEVDLANKSLGKTLGELMSKLGGLKEDDSKIDQKSATDGLIEVSLDIFCQVVIGSS